MKKTLGILGGMGPLATADLFHKITVLTKAASDQEHIHVLIDSDPSIPDRTDALLHGGQDPLPKMTASLRNLERAGAECIVMPCNTAHGFLQALQARTSLPILNMPALTAARCRELYGDRQACILATSGTLETGIYHRALQEQGVPFLTPEKYEEEILMHLIYDVVKASKPLQPEKETWQHLLDSLRAVGAEYFLLACTELPILAEGLAVPGPFVDPTAELARAAILFCGYEIREQVPV